MQVQAKKPIYLYPQPPKHISSLIPKSHKKKKKMLKPQFLQSQYSTKTLLRFHKPFFQGSGNAVLPVNSLSTPFNKKNNNNNVNFNIKAITTANNINTEKVAHGTVKITISVKPAAADAATDWAKQTINLQLVSTQLDKSTGDGKKTEKIIAHWASTENGKVQYEAKIDGILANFGAVGAVLVENPNQKEIFMEEIQVVCKPLVSFYFSCQSWVSPMNDNNDPRVFFTNKSYLPSQTPSGLQKLREEELKSLRGNGTGERQSSDRIYDYDVYNDLGDPDSNPELKRPVLGGKQFPYPRRCRTGRGPSQTDPSSEKRASIFPYVPRDEAFTDAKRAVVVGKLATVLPKIEQCFPHEQFPSFPAIDQLFNEATKMPPSNCPVTEKLDGIDQSCNDLYFETPEPLKRDRFFWLRDEEFARQTLAGLNPFSIKLVTEWPIKSKLDPEIYGPPESAISKEKIEEQIKGLMTFDEALEQNRLFILDYHDLQLPYVKKVRELEDSTLYGSRTLFFLSPSSTNSDVQTLRPLAIELTAPPMNGKESWKQVFFPSADSTDLWLWRLAKAHVISHDSAYHQLISHWLRTHCVSEPYIIASNRQLSEMHPIYRLLHPHFKSTMAINSLGRQRLINAGGTTETAFFTGKYSMELNAVAYDKLWRFDQQGLPADLISRGMAVEDPKEPHGLRLTIKDYPYANDGLDIWNALKEWISSYVNHYYPKASLIESDTELQQWWKEIREKGHEDKKDEPWWPQLKTPKDLIKILTTMTWVASGHHAAVNFGQYAYMGYFPNMPTTARINMPTEDKNEEKWKFFIENPEQVLLQCFPSQVQATRIMATMDMLSTHSEDEEYLGQKMVPAWGEDATIKAAFEKFKTRIVEIEKEVDVRNADTTLKNRTGAGIMPYKLLKPSSGSGVTGQGVPYSISI